MRNLDNKNKVKGSTPLTRRIEQRSSVGDSTLHTVVTESFKLTSWSQKNGEHKLEPIVSQPGEKLLIHNGLLWMKRCHGRS